jgi:hypothetical protein
MNIVTPLAWASFAAAAIAVASGPPSAEPTKDPKARSCIPLDQVVGRRTAGANAVEFDLIGGVTYRNELASSCVGIERLGPGATIAVTNAESGTLCAGDRVKLFDPVEVRATGLRSYPYCRLGSFVVSTTNSKH